MSLEIDFDFRSGFTSRFKIKEDWDRSGQEGEYFGNIVVNGMMWAIVLFDNEEDPDLYKADALLIEEKFWVSLRPCISQNIK